MGPSRPLAGTGPPPHRPAGDRLPGHEGQGEGLSLADDREASRRSRHPQSSILAVVLLLSAVDCQSEAERYFNQAVELHEATLYSEAIEEYTKANQLDGTFVKAYVNRGADYYNLGQYQRAIEDYVLPPPLLSSGLTASETTA